MQKDFERESLELNNFTKINDLKDRKGSQHRPKIIGRGIGSGRGRNATRGFHGQKKRSGESIRWFEGGQNSIIRRLPKRGFRRSDRSRETVLSIRDISVLVKKERLPEGTVINLALLKKKRLVKGRIKSIKILSGGFLQGNFTVEAQKFSVSAQEKLKTSGIKVNILDTTE